MFVVVFGENNNSIFKNSILPAEVVFFKYFFYFLQENRTYDLKRPINKHLVLAYVLENILCIRYMVSKVHANKRLLNNVFGKINIFD